MVPSNSSQETMYEHQMCLRRAGLQAANVKIVFHSQLPCRWLARLCSHSTGLGTNPVLWRGCMVRSVVRPFVLSSLWPFGGGLHHISLKILLDALCLNKKMEKVWASAQLFSQDLCRHKGTKSAYRMGASWRKQDVSLRTE